MLKFKSGSPPVRAASGFFLAVTKVLLISACAAGNTAQAAEDLSSPPITTAKAWVIADGSTGQVLAGHKPDEKLKSASTTKIMCARVVLELAKLDSNILDEVVTISKLADATDGSTAGVQAGERISVRDGLRGLMLVSGNDMGNALAEHFNARLRPPGEETPATVRASAFRTRCNFIAEMNREAARLGMTGTVYRMPYVDGGTDADRTTTARDLATLTHAAMKDPVFCEIVKTARYPCKVGTPKGKIRLLQWENTNQLLKLGGYDGVKTGMTNAAGYCLVASGEQDGVRLVVVVMGTVDENVRFAEARNLFRWWWGRR